MPTLDATASNAAVDMLSLDQFSFASQDNFGNLPGGLTFYSWITGGGDDLTAIGFGMTNNGSQPTGGTVGSVEIDLNDNGSVDYEITDIPLVSLVTIAGSSLDFLNTVFGGDDTMSGSDFDDMLKGVAGNDTIYGYDGNDTLNGGSGEDNLYGMEDNDNLAGGADNDDLHGGNGDDVLSGGSENDVLDGGEGTDQLDGGSGNDFLEFSHPDEIDGVETYTGGTGFDTVRVGFQTSGADLTYNLSAQNFSGIEEIEFGDEVSGPTERTVILSTAQFGGDQLSNELRLDGNSTSTDHTETVIINFSASQLDFDASAFKFQSWGTGGEEVVFNGNGFGNKIVGTSQVDVVNGLGGNDTILGSDGADDLDGGTGSGDTLDHFANIAGVTINLATNASSGGYATGDTISGFENVRGAGLFVNNLTGNTAANTLEGGALGDTLIGGDGNDILNGFGGADTMTGGVGADDMDGGHGDDTFEIGVSDVAVGESIVGGDGFDRIRVFDTGTTSFSTGVFSSIEEIEFRGSGANADRMATFQAQDFIAGGMQTVLLDSNGASGSTDVLQIFMSTALTLDLSGVTFQEWNSAGDQNDRVIVSGTGSAETITGTTEVDEISGADGSDVIEGGAGGDVLAGGGGSDTVRYTGSNAAVNINLQDQTASGGHAAGDTISGFENAIGSALNDQIFGLSTSASKLEGLGGQDFLLGGSASDTLLGGAADDTLNGGTGADVLDGGSGHDTVTYFGSGNAVNVNLETGIGTGGHAAGDTLSGIEELFGSQFSDTLTGANGADNVLTGNNGNDVLLGLSGQDQLAGGAGNDFLDGGEDKDVLDGGADFDTASYASSGAAVEVSLATGEGVGGSAEADTLIDIEKVIGSKFADILQGDNSANELQGNDGADDLEGQGGDDTLIGGEGDDVLMGGAGADTLDGGNGSDTASYAGSGTGVSANLATGTFGGGDAAGDILVSIENLIGTDFVDTLTGNSGANDISGGAGTDFIDGGAGADDLDGGAGVDVLAYAQSSAGVTVNLATGTGSGGDAQGDTLANFEHVHGSAFVDSLIGGAAGEVLNGGAGGDVLDGGAGTDTASFLGGNGVTVSLLTGIAKYGYAQGDTLISIENLSGSTFFDELTGDAGANVLAGDNGNDVLNGSNGDDLLFGGSGDDLLFGGAGADVFDGGLDRDEVSYAGSDAAIQFMATAPSQSGGHAQGDVLVSIEVVTGSQFDDSFAGGAGADTHNGGKGNDLFLGSLGADRYNGNQDIDTVDYSKSTTAVTVSLLSGVGSGLNSQAEGDILSNIENLVGSKNDDNLTGSAVDNVLSGGDGADEFNASNGNDTINGEGGDDVMVGGAGADHFDGGAGTDWAYWSNSDAAVSVNLATNAGTGGHAQGDTFVSVENLYGSTFGDVLTGDAGVNELNGFQGADTLNGLGGDDTLLGGLGDDWLNGGTGDDALSGYLGIDTFVYNATDFGNDTIIGFEDGTDRIDLNAGMTFADFTLAAFGAGSKLTLTADPLHSIVILGVAPGLIDAGDFI